MQINRQDLDDASNKGIITAAQAKKLWAFFESETTGTPSFQLFHVMYYFGGLLAISALTLFVTQAWETLRGLPLFLLSIAFFVLGILLTTRFLQNNLRIPAGITATFSLAIVPLAVYNIQYWLGYFPDSIFYTEYHYQIAWYWFPMEITTLAVGVAMLYFYGFPFIVFPIAVTLWYMSMDIVPLLLQMQHITYQDRALISMLFGILMIVAAIITDIRFNDKKNDYAFWLYIFGAMTFWGGLTCQDSHSELGKFVYCLINLGLIIFSVILNRRVFAVFGTIGVMFYLGHLAYSVFQGSLMFPIVLVFLGLFIIFIAAKWAQAESRLNEILKPFIPPIFRKRK